MNAQPAAIVMQAYGHEEVFHACLLALLSLGKVHAPEDCPQVWIYTDRPEWFAQWHCPLPLHYRPVEAETLKAWRGPTDFVHRVKIEVLRDFVRGFEGVVLYVDTDVLFLKNLNPMLARIAGGERFMHVSEGKLADGGSPMMVKLHRFLAKRGLMAGDAVNLSEVTMWNAGVIGFHTRDAAMLDEVLRLTDSLRPSFPKHIVEQFAFSVVWAKHGQIRNAFDQILHYWIIKEHKDIVASFFAHYQGRIWDELSRLSALIQIAELIQQKTSFFINRSLIGKMQKLRWVPQIPDWNALEKQL